MACSSERRPIERAPPSPEMESTLGAAPFQAPTSASASAASRAASATVGALSKTLWMMPTDFSMVSGFLRPQATTPGYASVETSPQDVPMVITVLRPLSVARPRPWKVTASVQPGQSVWPSQNASSASAWALNAGSGRPISALLLEVDAVVQQVPRPLGLSGV